MCSWLQWPGKWMPGEVGLKRGLPEDHKLGPELLLSPELGHFVLWSYEEGSRPHAWCCGVVGPGVGGGVARAKSAGHLGSQSLFLSQRPRFLPISPSTVTLCLALLP